MPNTNCSRTCREADCLVNESGRVIVVVRLYCSGPAVWQLEAELSIAASARKNPSACGSPGQQLSEVRERPQRMDHVCSTGTNHRACLKLYYASH